MTSRLQAVETREVPDEAVPARASQERNQTHEVATKMLLMAIQALSQRFVVALSNLFTLLTAASAFYLWMMALPEIDVLKIVALSIYSVFVLALNIYGRRK